MNHFWPVLGTLTALVVWGGLAIVFLAPYLKRQLAVLSVRVRRTPFHAFLGAVAVGVTVAYGGTKPVTKVAEMAGVKYERLADAVKACPCDASSTNEIRLLSDFECRDDDWAFSAGQKVAVDLNGHRSSNTRLLIDCAEVVVRDTSEAQEGSVELLEPADLSCGVLTLESGKLVSGQEDQDRAAVVVCDDAGRFDFLGGEIVTGDGVAAVYVSNGCIRVGGHAEARNAGCNVVLDVGALLELVSPLTGRVGITTDHDVEDAAVGSNLAGFAGAENLQCDGDPMLRGRTTDTGLIVWKRVPPCPIRREDVVIDAMAPTNFFNVQLTFGDVPMAVGDVVGMYRKSDGKLCGYGEAVTNADEEVLLSMNVRVAAGTLVGFSGWQAANGSLTNLVVSFEGSSPALTFEMPEAGEKDEAYELELSSARPDDFYLIDYLFLGDGENNETNAYSYTLADLPITLAPPKRDGYEFVGWVPNDGVIPVGTTGDLTFSAMWRELDPTPVTCGGGRVSTFEMSDDMGGGTAHVVGVGGLNERSFQLTKYRGNTVAMDGKPPAEDRAYWCFVGDDRLVDVEKDAIYDNEDDYWCSQFADLNLAYYGGWIPQKAYKTADEVAQKLRTTYSSQDSWTTFGWIMENRKTFGLGNKQIADYVVSYQGRFIAGEFLSFLERLFADGKHLVHLGVSGHGVTCCGYSVNEGGELNGLFIVDSDNDMFADGGAGKAPNSIMFCPVRAYEQAWNLDLAMTWPFLTEGDLLVANVFAEEWTPVDMAYALKCPDELPDPFELIVSEEGEVTGYYGDCEETVVIPDDVMSIREGTFRGCDALKKVILSESVDFVGAECFANCANLELVVVKSEKTRLMTTAFRAYDEVTGRASRLPKVQIVGDGFEIVGWKVGLESGDGCADDEDRAKARFYPADDPTDPFTVEGRIVWNEKFEEDDVIAYAAAPVAPFSYVVRFDANGGSGTMDEQVFTYGVKDGLNTNQFVNGEMHFQGWATTNAPDAAVAYLDGASVVNLVATPDVRNVDLFAVWGAERLKASVTFDAQGGSFEGGEVRTQVVEIGRTYDAVNDAGEFPEVPKRSGYVFEGWFAGTYPDGGDSVGNASSFCLDKPSTNVYAKWKDPSIRFLRDGVDCEGPLYLAPDNPLTVKITTPGFDSAAIGVKGLPKGFAFDKEKWTIAGRTSKSGVYSATVTATSPSERKGFAVRKTLTIVIPGGEGTHAAVPQCDAMRGNVSGGGIVNGGKKVTFKATAGKGYVFEKWSDGETTATHAPVEMTEDKEIVAFFLPIEEVQDSMSLKFSLDGVDYALGNGGDSSVDLDVLQGVYREWRLDASACLDVASVKVSGLPSGLKFKEGAICGAPSAESKWDRKLDAVKPSEVKVTVTTAGNVSKTFVLRMTVHPLPTWAVGTFSGRAEGGESKSAATLTVAASGKVSGTFSTVTREEKDDGSVKIMTDKWKYSTTGLKCKGFSVDKYTGDMSVEGLYIEAQAASGKKKAMVKIDIEKPCGISAACAYGEFGGEGDADVTGSLQVWRNAWKDKSQVQELTVFAKAAAGLYNVSLDGADSDYGCGYLSVTVDAKGGVKLSGKLPDGTAVSGSTSLVYDETRGLFIPLFISPSSYKGGYVSGDLVLGKSDGANYDLIRTGVEEDDGEGLSWMSLSPTATEEYGSGTGVMNLKVRGSRYDKQKSLYDWAGSRRLYVQVDALPVLPFTYRSDDGSDPLAVSDDPANDFAQSCPLIVNSKGKLVAVRKADKPKKDEDGCWVVEESDEVGGPMNYEAISVTFAPATGIFKGSFTCWYDYESSSVRDVSKMVHTSKKFSFEGIWVQDANGFSGSLGGFFLYDLVAPQTYDDEGNVRKTYKYKAPGAMSIRLDEEPLPES